MRATAIALVTGTAMALAGCSSVDANPAETPEPLPTIALSQASITRVVPVEVEGTFGEATDAGQSTDAGRSSTASGEAAELQPTAEPTAEPMPSTAPATAEGAAHRTAVVEATVVGDEVVGFEIVDPGCGYAEPPVLIVDGTVVDAEVVLTESDDPESDGAIASIALR